MRIAMAQMSMQMNRDSNLAKTAGYIQEAVGAEADLLFFPEVQLTPFFAQYRAEEFMQMGLDPESFAVDAYGEEIRLIRQMVRNAGIICSPNLYVQESEGECYDRSYMIDGGGHVLGTSDMVNIYSAPLFWEQDYYTPSKTGFQVYNTNLGRIGIVICFDRHLPESIRACAMQGAELILIPTANLKSEPLDVFEAEIRVEAFQNNVFIAMCNRVGDEGSVTFAGESLVVGPDGEVIKKADDTEQLVVADIDLSRAEESRANRNYIQFVS